MITQNFPKIDKHSKKTIQLRLFNTLTASLQRNKPSPTNECPVFRRNNSKTHVWQRMCFIAAIFFWLHPSKKAP